LDVELGFAWQPLQEASQKNAWTQRVRVCPNYLSIGFTINQACTIDVHWRCIESIRAGRENTWLCDPERNSLEELKGLGKALGGINSGCLDLHVYMYNI